METLVWILIISSVGQADIYSRPMKTVEQCLELRARASIMALARNEPLERTYQCVQFRIEK